MEGLFLSIFRVFKKSKLLFWVVFLLTLAAVAFGALQITIEENITKFFPDDARVKKLNHIFQNSAFAERIVVMVSIRDSSDVASADSLVAFSEQLAPEFEEALQPYNARVTSQVNDEAVLELFNTALQYLPAFLTEHDYQTLDSISDPENAKAVLRSQYQRLVSPSGIVLKRVIVNDPMGFSFLVLKKLQQLQYDDNFELYQNYIVTRDHRHLVLFVQPGYESNETGKNAAFIKTLSDVVNAATLRNPSIMVSYFGSAAVAVGNANQLRSDTILTLSLLGLLLAVFIVGFFRDWRAIYLMFVPVVFGALFALTCIALLKGTVSILALAAGSVILGIAVNYALHFLVHQRFHPDNETVIKDLLAPMTLGSCTTVLAFFCLQFTNAAVLRDIGLFAGFSLIGAALCSLIFLPHLSSIKTGGTISAIERLPRALKPSVARKLAIFILLLTPIFLIFAGKVKFNSDMSSLNFMTQEMRESQARLEAINPASLHTTYVSVEGTSLQQALKRNEQVSPIVDSLNAIDVIKRQHSLHSLLISDSLQQVRIDRWKNFWTAERKEKFTKAVHSEGQSLKFSPSVIARVDSIIDTAYATMDTATFAFLRSTFFPDNIIEKGGTTTILSLVNVLPADRQRVEEALSVTQASVADRQMITNVFVEFVHEDFNFIVTFTSVLVFVVLLISFGRIELTLITFLPMLITWIWILGIMALVGIEFNIVNVMISTFIFGLGDDYSIFVMDGLLQRHKTGKDNLHSVRISILLSALTTISGLGVLIFAEHPALRSIAAIAIIGIVCVFIMSQTIEPFLFSWIIGDRTRRKLPPMTFKGMFVTTITYSLFVFGSFFLTLVGLIFRLIPFGKKSLQLIYHRMISFFTGAVMNVAFNLKKKFINIEDSTFGRPGIIIANHSSFLDILLTAMMNPRVVLLTNKWVWNSPIFGGVVRLAGYYPITEGAEQGTGELEKRVKEGYSIVVFPEGTRSPDGSLKRFHKGAFYLAEVLRLPVYPLLIKGAGEAVPKSTMYVNDAAITLKMLPPIEPNDVSFGNGYAERTKAISRHFKQEYAKFVSSELTPESCKYRLHDNFRYKGPVLEWYLKIKVRLEDYYKVFHSLVPANARVLDLGCGYGFLCYMLHFLSKDRVITGIDYDEEKIAVANHGYLEGEQLTFHHHDITTAQVGGYDVIFILDVLHYLAEEDQYNLLERCFHALPPGGKIIVRDGDADVGQRHSGTKVTEFFSVYLLRFNKSNKKLSYISGRKLTAFAAQHGLTVSRMDEGKLTSNVVFIISK